MQDLFQDNNINPGSGTQPPERYGNLFEEYSKPPRQQPEKAAGAVPPAPQSAPAPAVAPSQAPQRQRMPQPAQQQRMPQQRGAQAPQRSAQPVAAQNAQAPQRAQQTPPAPKRAPAAGAQRQRMPVPPAPQKAPAAQRAPQAADSGATQAIVRGKPQPALAGAGAAGAGAAYTDDPTRIGAPIDAASAAGKGRGGSGNGGSGGGRGGSKGGGGKKKKKKQSVGKHIFANICKAFFCVFCVGLLIVGMMAVWVADYVVESTRDDDMLLDLDNMARSENGYILAYNPETGQWQEYQNIIGSSNSIWTPLSEISPYVIDALISTEDKDFYNHNGFSITRTLAAGLNQVFHFRSNDFGASTIDQQLVKNLTGDDAVFDEDGGMSSGYLRKLREIFRAIGLNNNYSKDTILTAYLNTMPLSGTIEGVGGGARQYFNKTPSELTIWEAATIVGITKHPVRYNPYLNPDNCVARRDDVLTFMWQDGKITDTEYYHALEQPLGLYEGEVDEDETATSETTSWFADEVYRQVTDDLVTKGIVDNPVQATTYYYNNGLRIESTVDLSIQSTVEDLYLHAYEEGNPFPTNGLSTYALDSEGNATEEVVWAQSSMVVMDYEGRVLAIAGGTGEKEGSLVFNRATMSKRQVGSTMKMIGAYALGIELDLINWSSMRADSASLTSDAKIPSTPEGAVWPRNYAGQGNGQFVSVQHAVAKSLNTVAVRVGMTVGVEDLYDFVVDTLGVSTLTRDGSADLSPSSLILGGNYEGMYNLELTAAYAMYGNEGTYYKPRFYERVLDKEGNVIMTADNYGVQAISAESSYIGNRLMRTVMTDGAGTALGMSPNRMDSVAKTGTTNDDKDRWLVGLTPYYVTGIWVGYDDNYVIKAGTIRNNPNTIVWRWLMNELQEDLEERSFPPQPGGVVQKAYCTVSGLLAIEGCPTATGYYKDTEWGLPDECQGVHDMHEPEE